MNDVPSAASRRPLGRTGLLVSPIAFGAFKIGRNQNVRYARAYDLPTEEGSSRLLNAALDLGINLIDTAPAYGLAEERIGRHLAGRRAEFLLSTKVGETFEDGVSTYDFSAPALRRSVERSLARLRTDAVDLLLLHSDGHDLDILQRTDAVSALLDARQRGLARFVGLSGKTAEGARLALAWADALMVEYHARDATHAPVIAEAAARGVAVLVKKPLASGAIPPAEAIPYILRDAGVSTVVLGTLSADHLAEALSLAAGV